MFGNLAQITRSIGGIAGLVNNAVKVSQVNEQLAYLEQSYQDYNQSLQQKMFDVRGEMEITGPSGGQTPSVVKKPFGQASLADIEADENKFFQAQLDYITKNTTNRDARREMIQHLNMKNIANKGAVANQWNVAAYHEAMASFNSLYSTVLASNDPWEVKVNKITVRAREMERAGRLWPDEAEAIIAKATAAAQYSFAHNGAMTIMKQTGDLAAGETWLKQNTPFYDGNPDARESVLNDVRQEFAYFAKTADAELDISFADLHIRADTIEKVEMALVGLRDTKFYDGDKKYIWEQRFMAKREFLINSQTMPAGDLDDVYKAREEWWKGFLALEKDRGNYTREQLRKMIEEDFYGIDAAGTNIPKIRGPFVQWAVDYLKVEDTPGVKSAMDILDETLKGKGIPAADAAPLINAFNDWLAKNLDADAATITKAATNIASPVAKRNLTKTLDRTLDALRRDEADLTELEKMTAEIQNYDWVGIQDLEGRRELLAQYNAALLDKAQRDYPQENLLKFYTDETGEYTGFPGTAMLISAANRAYIYKLEGKVLTLWGRLTVATRAEQKEGEPMPGGRYEWQLISKPGTAKAEETAIEMKEAEARAAEREEAEKELIERTRTPGRGRGGR